jgi:alkanesulfonate monooxygenase SsuD/methylene tetrahydromethanopterin reductase-like flavin-dependent oxidoreductase (luciferase family)
MAFAHFLAGTPIQVPPIDTALQYLERHPESLAAVARRRRAIIGTPSVVRDQLMALAAEYEADEMMVVTITYDHRARRRSYELLADAFATSG